MNKLPTTSELQKIRERAEYKTADKSTAQEDRDALLALVDAKDAEIVRWQIENITSLVVIGKLRDEIARKDAALEKAETLTKAVGRVLTWSHNADGVVVVREDHMDNLKPAFVAFYDAFNDLRRASEPPTMTRENTSRPSWSVPIHCRSEPSSNRASMFRYFVQRLLVMMTKIANGTTQPPCRHVKDK